jgi:hypothetical protein
MLKKLLAIFQLAGAGAFLTMFFVTVFGIDHIKELSREFITTKLESSSGTVVSVAEEALASKAVQKYLSEEQIQTFVAEIELYHQNPKEYIEVLTSETKEVSKANVEAFETLSPLVKPLAEKVFLWKTRLKEHFNEMFMKIIFDLRLFALSNVFGFGVAFWLSRQKSQSDKRYLAGSILLTISIAYQSMMYVDQNWFFTLLFDSFLGVTYPAMICITWGWLMFEHFKSLNDVLDPKPESQAQTTRSNG